MTALTTTLVGSTNATSVPADAQCPEAVLTGDLVDGQPVNGLTVSKGTAPEPFTGEVIGVIDNGIAPGLDMILVRLSSTEIDRVGGIWAGMSGSPVYDAAGDLIGAVSYGLSFGPSTVAGVTPAADMQALLSSAPASPAAKAALRAARGANKVAIPGADKRSLVAGGDATKAQVDGGLRRLPVPLGISGMASTQRLNQAAKYIGAKDVKVFHSGAAPVGAAATDIVAGGNLAASLSYGDLTAVGVGTATAVCGDEVIAFGHPMTWSGPSTLTMHGADALYVQEDPTLVPFKVANPTGPVGTIDQDRMAGLHGVTGDAPAATTVRTNTRVGATGTPRNGTTKITVGNAVPEIGAFAVLAGSDRVFDGIGAGSAKMAWTVKGERGNGTPFEFTRRNRFVSGDITFEPIFDLYEQLAMVQFNEFTDARITDVNVRTTLSREQRAFNVASVKIWRNGRFVPMTSGRPNAVRRGTEPLLQVKLTSYRNRYGTLTKNFRVAVPGHLRPGEQGALEVVGGSEFFGGDFEEEEGPTASSFNELLSQLARAPRNDELYGVTSFFRGGEEFEGTIVSRTRKVAMTDVIGGARLFPIRVVG